MVKVALAPAPPQTLASKRPVVSSANAPANVPRIAAKKPMAVVPSRAVLSAASAATVASSITTTRTTTSVSTSTVKRVSISSASSPSSISSGSSKASVVSATSASSPAASSPTSTTGPVSKISTSKVWVLPPRPKPGRKPSVDTPQNKRKAQNRAAQRAFRERRAAMVGELEEKLAEVNQERDAREARLEAQLKAVVRENEDLKRSLRDLHLQMAKQNSGYQMASPAMSSHESPMDILDRVLEERLPVPNVEEKSKINTSQTVVQTSTTACTVCVNDDCICAAVGIKVSPNVTSTSTSVSLKRPQPETNDEPFEIDFTEMYSRPSKKQAPAPAPSRAPSPVVPPTHRTSSTRTTLRPPADRCGFCSDGTPCMCAEAEAEEAEAKEKASQRSNLIDDIEEDNTLPPIVLNNIWSSSYQNTAKLPALHPGPSREIPVSEQPAALAVTMSKTKTNGDSSPNYECTGNPGTCMQCQTDPMSTLFCTTLASRPNASPKTTSAPATTPSSSSSPGAFISASAAYRTLSRHKDFRRADFGALVGKLNTRGMQVEVNSVANVLRELDRRLYSS